MKLGGKRLLIIGAQGQGKVTLDCTLFSGMYNHIEFMRNYITRGGIEGYKIMDKNKTSIEYIRENFDEVIVAVGLNKAARLKGSTDLEKQGIELATIVHPTAMVSPFSEIGSGSVILANAVVNPCAQVGKACLINTGSIVEHDCIIDNELHQAPNATGARRVPFGNNSSLCYGCRYGRDLRHR